MAIQDSSYRNPDESRDAQHSYTFEACTAQLKWTGHDTRMLDKRLPKKVFYGEFEMGKRSQGGQKKRCKNTLNVSRMDFYIPPKSWEQNAKDRAK